MSLSPSTPAGLRCQTRCKNNIPPSKPPYKYVGSQAKLKVCPPCSHSSQFGGALAGRNCPAATSTRRDGRGEVTAQAGRLPPAGFSAHQQLPWSSLSPHTLLPLGAARILSARRPPRPGRPHNNAADRPHQPHRPLPARLHRQFCACQPRACAGEIHTGVVPRACAAPPAAPTARPGRAAVWRPPRLARPPSLSPPPRPARSSCRGGPGSCGRPSAAPAGPVRADGISGGGSGARAGGERRGASRVDYIWSKAGESGGPRGRFLVRAAGRAGLRRRRERHRPVRTQPSRRPPEPEAGPPAGLRPPPFQPARASAGARAGTSGRGCRTRSVSTGGRSGGARAAEGRGVAAVGTPPPGSGGGRFLLSATSDRGCRRRSGCWAGVRERREIKPRFYFIFPPRFLLFL